MIDPFLMRRLMGWQVLLWIAMFPIGYLTGWVNSSAFISYLSLYALVLAAGSWYESLAVKCKQMEEADEDVADEVVDRIVEKTDVSPS